MSSFSVFGQSPVVPQVQDQNTEHILIRRTLSRVLEFTGRTIDDVVNCPIARNEVSGYFCLHRWVERQCEISELERQWNSVHL
jgi:hypothetical protein